MRDKIYTLIKEKKFRDPIYLTPLMIRGGFKKINRMQNSELQMKWINKDQA